MRESFLHLFPLRHRYCNKNHLPDTIFSLYRNFQKEARIPWQNTTMKVQGKNEIQNPEKRKRYGTFFFFLKKYAPAPTSPMIMTAPAISGSIPVLLSPLLTTGTSASEYSDVFPSVIVTGTLRF